MHACMRAAATFPCTGAVPEDGVWYHMHDATPLSSAEGLCFGMRREFVQLAVGGPLTGLAFGVATTVWLRYMYNNATAEITLTVLSAYGTYLVANELFNVSAVLAVVVLGRRDRPCFSSAGGHRAASPAEMTCVLCQTGCTCGVHALPHAVDYRQALMLPRDGRNLLHAGFWMAAKGLHAISRKVEHPLHIIWCARCCRPVHAREPGAAAAWAAA